MTSSLKNIKPRLLPPPDVDEQLHAIVQGVTPLVVEGLVPAAHVGLLLSLGWALDGAPQRHSRRHWSCALRGERGGLEVHLRSGQVAGAALLLRGRQPVHLDWRETERVLRHDGRASAEDRCEVLGRLVAAGGWVALDLSPLSSLLPNNTITDGGEP